MESLGSCLPEGKSSAERPERELKLQEAFIRSSNPSHCTKYMLRVEFVLLGSCPPKTKN